MKNTHSIIPIFAGLALGVVGGATVAGVGIAMASDEASVEWLDKWQPLFSGALATGAATLTVLGIYWQTLRSEAGVERQIAEHRRRAEKERKRELIAAKAMLVQPLSTLFGICRKAASELAAMDADLEGIEDGHVPCPRRLQPIQSSHEMLAALRDCIRLADAEDAPTLAAIIREHQVMLARYEIDEPPSDTWTPNSASDARDALHLPVQSLVILMLLVDWVFPYARDQRGHIGKLVVTERQYADALRVLGVTDAFNNSVKDDVRQSIFIIFGPEGEH